MLLKTLGECQKIVAIKHKLINENGKGAKTLVTGHKKSYFDEAAEIYCQQYKDLLVNQIKEK